MVRSKNLMCLGESMLGVWLGLEGLEERVIGRTCQEAFIHTWRMG